MLTRPVKVPGNMDDAEKSIAGHLGRSVIEL